MTPNPLTRESEARRDGSWVRVYGLPIILTVMFCALGGYLGFLSYRSTHPEPPEPEPPVPTNWTLHNQNHSIEVAGTVPGGVYSDLLASGVLSDGDFYYRYNDLNYRWVANDNWTYTTTFDVDPKITDYKRVLLIFKGVDTVSEIYLNGILVGTTNNMFVRYVFDVKEALQSATEATLEVKFQSPLNYAKNAYEEQLQDYLVPPKCVPKEQKGECHANHIRKMPASFSWDWGPAFPSMGIWKKWWMEGVDSLRISDLLFTATPTQELPTEPDYSFETAWNVSVEVVFDAGVKSGTIHGDLTIYLEDLHSEKISVDVIVEDFIGTVTVNFTIDEVIVDMWWPNGFGNGSSSALYYLMATWWTDTGSSSHSVRVGFRTVELNQDFVDPANETLGRHYRVFVNNVYMFMKGSNWIPAHVLPERVSEEYTVELLEAAAKTGQNCIRVWGGGIYESDLFYEIADQLGILIWEDFMFACNMYPVTEPFLDTVRDEVKTQVRRLQHHASILLWAANNENEAALRSNWYGTQPDFDRYEADYIKLYVDTIRNVTQSLDTSRPFAVSSPNNGIESEEEGHVAQHPYSNNYGDVHYYNYVSDAWNWKQYPRTRFASEYGFQSWPSFISMKNVTLEEDWSSTSPLSYHRQHHAVGQEELALEIGLHMHLPYQDGSAKSYEHYLYLSQIHQAMAIKTQTEFYRRGMSDMNEAGEGYTSGALYWQLNDIWQGASWASIEFGGRWKMLHYFTERFFNPVLVSLYQSDDNLEVVIVNDQYKTHENLKLSIELHRYDQRKSILIKDTPITVESMKAEVVASYNLWDDLDLEENCHSGIYDELDVCFVVSRLTSIETNEVLAFDNFYLLGKPKDAYLLKANVKIQSISGPFLSQRSNNSFNVTVSSNNVALFVWLETEVPGVFSDNGFLMVEETMEISFFASQETTKDALTEYLTVKSLTDTYDAESVAFERSEAVMDRALHPNDIRNWLFV